MKNQNDALDPAEPELTSIRGLELVLELVTELALLGTALFFGLGLVAMVANTVGWLGSHTATLMAIAAILAPLVLLGIYSAVEPRRKAVHARRVRLEAARDPRPPWLLLRSFRNELISRSPSDVVVSGNMYSGVGESERGNQSATRFLARGVSTWGRLVALSWTRSEARQKGEDDVLYLEESEHTWRRRVERIVGAARGILVIPESTPCLLDEIDSLRRSDALRKVLVWMPPGIGTVADRWESLRTELAGSGIQLPCHDSRGTIYVPNQDMSIRKSHSLDRRYDDETIRAALTALLPELQGAVAALSEVLGDEP